MTTRYTVKDVRNAFSAAAKAAASVGIDSNGWELNEASAANGRPYRLYGPGQSSLNFTSGNGYLGATARQACDTLWHYAGAWWAVADLRRDASE